MAESKLQDQQAATSTAESRAEPRECEECLGSGGWFRYDPALESAPGRLYLSCLQCRGSGRMTVLRA